MWLYLLKFFLHQLDNISFIERSQILKVSCMIEHAMYTWKISIKFAFVLCCFVDVILAEKGIWVYKLLVKQVFVLKLWNKKSVLFLILGKLEIVSLIAVVACDCQNFFIFWLLEYTEKWFQADITSTFKDIERIGLWVNDAVGIHRAYEFFKLHFNY